MPLKNAKAKGSRNERRSIALLESAGYACTKSGGSLGVFDIIGISKTDVLLVQVKSNREPPPHEREQMRDFMAPKNARKLIHVWKDRKALPHVTEL